MVHPAANNPVKAEVIYIVLLNEMQNDGEDIMIRRLSEEVVMSPSENLKKCGGCSSGGRETSAHV